MGFLLKLLVSIIFPPILLGGFFIVNPNEEVVLISFGEYLHTFKREGINWAHPLGRILQRISIKATTLDVKSSTVVDLNGNPIHISAVVVYRVMESRKAALDVENYSKFLADQAGAVIKRVCSRYPYESTEDKPCLKKENPEITSALNNELQSAVNPAGIRALSVKFNDLTYSPEIAQAMLMRQQAIAFIAARKTIVEGAVELVKDAIDRLKNSGFDFPAEKRDELIANLLIVLCGGEGAKPVIQVQSSKVSKGMNRKIIT